MAKLSAPFTPFMAESIYQNLVPNFYKDAPISVHLCDFPKANESAIDKDLEDGMQNVLDIVVLGRACRNTSNIKNRQPLSKIFVCSERKAELTEGLLEIAKDELNVKQVEYLTDAASFVTYKIKPQLKTLGPKYGAKLGKVRKFFETCDANQVVSTVKSGVEYTTEFEGDTFTFSMDDLLISTESAQGFIASSDNGMTVVMDTTVTEELKAEGVERELISKIQTMRKEAGFEVTDHIEVYVSGNDTLSAMMQKYSESLLADVLAQQLHVDCVDGYVKEWNINGETASFGVKKI
jgi:isoleucyl-tRNA synthetase